MTHDDHERIKGYVDTAINRRLVGVLTWLILAILANAGTMIAGVALAIADRQKILSGQTDRWTGTMAHAAEMERAHINPGYNSIQTRDIQKQYQQ